MPDGSTSLRHSCNQATPARPLEARKAVKVSKMRFNADVDDRAADMSPRRRLGRRRSAAALGVTTISGVKAVARMLAKAREHAEAQFVLRHPRGGSNCGRAIKVRLFDRRNARQRRRSPFSVINHEALLDAVLPPAFADGCPKTRLVHMELIFYGRGCSGHWHVDPTEEGDEIVILTIHGNAMFELREKGGTTIDATRTQPGTLVRLAGPARHKCEHRAGVADGGVRVALQLGFSNIG